jgi:hypothetical protein
MHVAYLKIPQDLDMDAQGCQMEVLGRGNAEEDRLVDMPPTWHQI